MTIHTYVTTTFRNLKSKKGVNLTNVLGLAIGMSAALLILSYVAFEYSFDSMHHLKERLFRVEARFYENGTLTDDWATSSFGYATAMKQDIKGIEAFTRVASRFAPEQIVKYGEQISRENGIAYADGNFFKLFDFPLSKGDRETCLASPNQVVITELMAKKYFKNEDPIGKILVFRSNGPEVACEVSGVMEEMPANSHIRYNMLISYTTLPNWAIDYWYKHEVYTYVLLESKELKNQVEAAFPAMAEKYKTEEALRNKEWAIQLVNLKDIHLTPQKAYEMETKGNRAAMLILIVGAILILCIAWINYINMAVARSLERAKEIAVRKVAGANHQQILLQFLTESLIINAIAITIALVMIKMAFPAFSNLTGSQLNFSIWLSTPLGIILMLLFSAGILLSGIYPASIFSSMQPIKMLKGKFTHSKNAASTRKTLIIIQYAASLTLLCATLVIYAQLKYMNQAPLGINKEQVLSIKFPAHCQERAIKIDAMRKEVANLPQVKQVTVSGAIPGTEIADFLSIQREGDMSNQTKLLEMLICDEHYQEAYELDLVAGRFFSEEYGNEKDKLLINESAVATLGFRSPEDALHKNLMVETVATPMQIIGVLKDYHQQSLTKNYTPFMLALHDNLQWMTQRFISVKTVDCNQQELTNEIGAIWNRYFPESSYDYFFLDQFYDHQYHQQEVFGKTVALFALLAIFISCMGLGILVMYSCTTRTREMGIRKVLGASNQRLFYELGKEFFFLIGIAIVIALPISYWMMERWLSHFPFRTSIQPWFFLVPTLMITIISLLTIVWQTAKTIITKPAISIRYE